MKELKGVIIPAVTPFDENDQLDLARLEYNYTEWNKTNVNGYMCLGSNGEFRSLSDDEAFAVIEAASKFTAPEKILIAGVGRESLAGTLAFIKRLQDAEIKIDYISVLTPHYFKGLMTDDALVEYFTAVADFSKYPVLLYCAPSFANEVCISVEAAKRLADHPNIHGIKDTSKHMMNDYMAALGGRKDFVVMAGSISTMMNCIKQGGAGGVISCANYFPAESAKFYELFVEGGEEGCKDYYAKLSKLAKETGGRGSVAGVKATMNLVGLKGGYPRKPVQPVSAELLEQIKAGIAAREI